MLENRETMMQLFPELFAAHRGARRSRTIRSCCCSTLAGVCARTACDGEPTVAVLTPGIYNSAYFEHSFLADQMGVELVEGQDLVVDGRHVYDAHDAGAASRSTCSTGASTTTILDPLTFQPDSMLGVPGIMDVYRAGDITIANAPGAGIADDKAIYTYMPEIIEFYTGRKADPAERADLALRQAGRACTTCSSTSTSWW